MHLVDVNVWIALTFEDHVHHESALRWFRMTTEQTCFCRLTQIGFLRLATNSAFAGPAAVGMSDAWSAYHGLLRDAGVIIVEEPPGIEKVWQDLTQGSQLSPKLWNDAYLAAFALLAGYEIVTFDRGFAQFKQVKSTILT